MGSILGWLAGWIGQYLVPVFIKELAQAIKDWSARREKLKEEKRKADASVEPLKNAKTGEDIDKSADNALGDV